MSRITSKKHTSTALLTLATALPLFAHAADSNHPIVLPTIDVKAEDNNPYKTEKVSSAKYTQPLIDTPQTVSVIKKELLQEQGAASLVEALRNTPGITLQLGENGNTSAGDTFQMRGFSTQTSTFVDGIRDLGAVSRDVFNLDQIEVVKGAAGSESGRGASAGYINLVSKLPQAENSREVSLNWNTANHGRLTADINQAIRDDIAVRLNVMGQTGDIEGRDVVENESYAIAPSIAFGLNSDTRFYLYSQHIRQDNIPDGGIPTIGMKGFYNADPLLNAAPKVDRKNFYGNVHDYEDVDADMYTAKIEADLSENLKLTNLSRYGETQMNRALTGVIALNTNNSTQPNDWTVNRSHQGVDQQNKILANQSILNWNFNTGTIKHNAVIGLEFLKESQKTRALSTQIPGQTAPIIPPANLYHPNSHDVLPKLNYTGAYTDGETQTAAAYFFDTLKFWDDRLQLNAGVRVDYYDTEYDALAVSTDSKTLAITQTPTQLEANDTLVSWKLGGLFKPTSNSSVYATYAKSLTPPGGANFALSDATSGTQAANNPVAKPQETHHYEIGGKWDVLKEKLALTAAIYRTENENQFTQDAITLEAIQEGKTIVEGVELGVVGQITDAWNISAGVAHMKADQENQLSVSSAGVITNTTGVRWSPEWSASLWSTYQYEGFKVGLGARYVGEQKRLITDSTVPVAMPEIPDYVVFDAMTGYTFNQNASINLNVYNLADKEYISTLNNGGGRLILGQPRSAALTLNYKF